MVMILAILRFSDGLSFSSYGRFYAVCYALTYYYASFLRSGQWL